MDVNVNVKLKQFCSMDIPSSGSYTSINSDDDNAVTWCNGIFLLRISAIVTALLIARPIAFRMI